MRESRFKRFHQLTDLQKLHLVKKLYRVMNLPGGHKRFCHFLLGSRADPSDCNCGEYRREQKRAAARHELKELLKTVIQPRIRE